jgi:hypothetical protein
VVVFSPFKQMFFTVESRLTDLNGTKGRPDNKKCPIIRKNNEKYKGKYKLNL